MLKEVLKQIEQGSDLASRAIPIVGRKRVQSQGLDSQRWSGPDDASNGRNAGAMAFLASKSARGRPAAIAIEQNRNVKPRVRVRELSY